MFHNNKNNSSPISPNMSEYYNNQENTSRYVSNLGNNSTKSLGGATAVGTPRINPTENANEVNSLNLHYNRQYQGEMHQQSPRSSTDEESLSGSILTKRDSTSPLAKQSTHDLGDVRNQNHSEYNQSDGFYPQYNKQYRQDGYYDEEATRHNTLALGDPYSYGFENEYTDRDFPGSGKGARQSMTGEHLNIPITKKKRRCCGCCSWPICILITVIVLIVLGVIAFFVLPRVPTVDVKNAIPVSVPNISVNPPVIDMNFTMVVEVDNDKNYVPYKFNRIDVSVFDRDANTDNPIATGTTLDYTLQPKRVDTLNFPLSVNYKAQNQNDPVIQNFITACSPKIKEHSTLKLRVDVVLFVWGIDWIYKPKISVPVPDMKCPVPV